MWGLQVRPRSPRRLPPTPPPAAPILAQSVLFFFFFLSRRGRGTQQAPTWGATATLGAGVNQSPERRGAAARARAGWRAGGRGEAEAARAAARRKSGGGGKERPRQKEREAAEGLVQARPLRGDQEAGAALDNQHAEMVRSFHPPFLFILDFGRKEPRARAPRGPRFPPVLRREVEGRAGRKGEPPVHPAPEITHQLGPSVGRELQVGGRVCARAPGVREGRPSRGPRAR